MMHFFMQYLEHNNLLPQKYCMISNYLTNFKDQI